MLFPGRSTLLRISLFSLCGVAPLGCVGGPTSDFPTGATSDEGDPQNGGTTGGGAQGGSFDAAAATPPATHGDATTEGGPHKDGGLGDGGVPCSPGPDAGDASCGSDPDASARDAGGL